MIRLLGILGGICFALAGLPAAYQSFKAGKSVGTPVTIAWLTMLGTIFMYLYLLASYGFDPILTVNYTTGAVSWGIIVYYHYFPKKV